MLELEEDTNICSKCGEHFGTMSTPVDIPKIKQGGSLMPKKIDHTNTQLITCPECGRTKINSCDFEDEGEEDCDCGATYSYERNIYIDYSTELIPAIDLRAEEVGLGLATNSTGS